MEMVPLISLWLPILGSAVAVFLASSIVWMVLPHHKSDWSKLSDEEGVRAALEGVAPGEYTIPHAASSSDWKSEAWQEKAKTGPNAFISVIPSGLPNMGKNLGQWFVYCLIVSTCVAYVVSRTVAPGIAYLAVFRIAGTVAFLAYSMAHISGAIWMGHGWGRTIKDVIDGFVYGLLTGGVFGWLWP